MEKAELAPHEFLLCERSGKTLFFEHGSETLHLLNQFILTFLSDSARGRISTGSFILHEMFTGICSPDATVQYFITGRVEHWAREGYSVATIPPHNSARVFYTPHLVPGDLIKRPAQPSVIFSYLGVKSHKAKEALINYLLMQGLILPEESVEPKTTPGIDNFFNYLSKNSPIAREDLLETGIWSKQMLNKYLGKLLKTKKIKKIKVTNRRTGKLELHYAIKESDIKEVLGFIPAEEAISRAELTENLECNRPNLNIYLDKLVKLGIILRTETFLNSQLTVSYTRTGIPLREETTSHRDTRIDDLQDKILFLINHNDNNIFRSYLLRKLRIKISEFNTAIESLIEDGRLIEKPATKKNYLGEKMETTYLIPNDAEEDYDKE
jgi:predicted transcriptional regulator